MRYLVLLFLIIVLSAPVQAATQVVYANGTVTFTVPASQYLNVMGADAASVFKNVGYPNIPSSWVIETNGLVNGAEVQFGPYTYATQIRIDAGPMLVRYSIGAGGLAIPCSQISASVSPSIGSFLRVTSRIAFSQPVPTAKTTAVTLTSAELLTGIITGTHTAGSTQAYTLPTGTLLEAAVPQLQIGEGFEWVLINLSAAAADSITLTAGTDHTIVGSAIVISTHVTTGGAITSQGCNSSVWITKKTAANTFVTYRKS